MTLIGYPMRRRHESGSRINMNRHFPLRQRHDLPIPVSLPVEVVAQSPEQAIEKLKRLVPLRKVPGRARWTAHLRDAATAGRFLPNAS
jgi:hypothetical protein